jgi:hypothetical protein
MSGSGGGRDANGKYLRKHPEDCFDGKLVCVVESCVNVYLAKSEKGNILRFRITGVKAPLQEISEEKKYLNVSLLWGRVNSKMVLDFFLVKEISSNKKIAVIKVDLKKQESFLNRWLLSWIEFMPEKVCTYTFKDIWIG